MSKNAIDKPFLFIRHQLLELKASSFDFLGKALIEDSIGQFSVKTSRITSPILRVVYRCHIIVEELDVFFYDEFFFTFLNVVISMQGAVHAVLIAYILSHQTLQYLILSKGFCLPEHMVLTIPMVFSST